MISLRQSEKICEIACRQKILKKSAGSLQCLARFGLWRSFSKNVQLIPVHYAFISCSKESGSAVGSLLGWSLIPAPFLEDQPTAYSILLLPKAAN